MLTRNIGPTWPKSEYDDFPAGADGRKVGQMDTAELTSRLAALGIEGFAKVYDAAGKAAVEQWLRGAA